MNLVPIIIMFNAVFSYCVTFEVDISNAEIPDGNFIVLMNGQIQLDFINNMQF